MTDRRHTARVRLRKTTGQRSFDHAPPVVIWRCPKRHLVLRVFLTRTGWHIIGEPFRVALDDWLNRIGTSFSVDHYRTNTVTAMDARKVSGIDKELPLHLDAWPTGRFEAGCRCGSKWFDISQLAANCETTRTTRRPVLQTC